MKNKDKKNPDIIRSSSTTLNFSNIGKINNLDLFIEEYKKVVSLTVDYLWNLEKIDSLIPNEITSLISNQTWLSARLRKVAAREALDMISASKERWKNQPKKLVKPVHKGKRMYVSCTIAELKDSKEASEFDAWLHIFQPCFKSRFY